MYNEGWDLWDGSDLDWIGVRSAAEEGEQSAPQHRLTPNRHTDTHMHARTTVFVTHIAYWIVESMLDQSQSDPMNWRMVRLRRESLAETEQQKNNKTKGRRQIKMDGE